MPGIAGFAGSGGTNTLLATMLHRMKHHPWYTSDAWIDEDGQAALGRVGLGYDNGVSQPATSGTGVKRVVLEGEIYDYATLRSELEASGRQFRSTSHAELLLHGWESQGIDFVQRLNGCFAAAIWDRASGTVTLLNDRFGMRPLYYSVSPGRIAFGSEIKALLADRDLSRAIDPRGLAQFFTFGQYLGNTTSFAAVSLLPAAGVLTFEVASDRLRIQKYHRLGESWATPVASAEDSLERIDNALAKSVARCTNGTAKLGLSLSGGLDARTILGLIDPDQPVKTLCLGIEGSIDVRCAAELARLTGRTHRTHTLDSSFLGQFGRHMRDMVHLTDGQYLSQCIVMPTLPMYREMDIEVLVRGHAGELMHMTKAYNFSLDSSSLNLTDSSLEGWLWQHLQSHMLDGVAGPLFTPEVSTNLAEVARQSLRECLAESAGAGPPVHRICHLFVSERIRRETGLSMSEFGSVVETRLPYLDREVIDSLMAASPNLKLGEDIQSYILRKRQPSFLNVVNANTGAKLGSSPLVKTLSKLRLKVLAKLGVKGYQPYERLGLWLRRELRPLVESLLLDRRCLERGVFNPETVRTTVENHFNGRHNHTFLLMGMMIFELGQRELVDAVDSFENGPLAFDRVAVN
jgi:asparagine synthase (glutamine-hydrolysing)